MVRLNLAQKFNISSVNLRTKKSSNTCVNHNLPKSNQRNTSPKMTVYFQSNFQPDIASWGREKQRHITCRRKDLSNKMCLLRPFSIFCHVSFLCSQPFYPPLCLFLYLIVIFSSFHLPAFVSPDMSHQQLMNR